MSGELTPNALHPELAASPTMRTELRRALAQSTGSAEDRRDLLRDVRDLLQSGRTSVAFFAEPECTGAPIFNPASLVSGQRYFTRPSESLAGLRCVRTGPTALQLIEAGGESVDVDFGCVDEAGPITPIRRALEPEAPAPAPAATALFSKKKKKQGGAAEQSVHRELEMANLELMRRRRELRNCSERLAQTEAQLEDRAALQAKYRELVQDHDELQQAQQAQVQAQQAQGAQLALLQSQLAESAASANVLRRHQAQAQSEAHESALRYEEQLSSERESHTRAMAALNSAHERQLAAQSERLEAAQRPAPSSPEGNMESLTADIRSKISAERNRAMEALRAAKLKQSEEQAEASQRALEESQRLHRTSEEQVATLRRSLDALQSDKDSVVGEWSRSEIRCAKLEASHEELRAKLKKARAERDALRRQTAQRAAPRPQPSTTAPGTPTSTPGTPEKPRTPQAQIARSSSLPDRTATPVRNTHFVLWNAAQKEEQLRSAVRKCEAETKGAQQAYEELKDSHAALSSKNAELHGALSSRNAELRQSESVRAATEAKLVDSEEQLAAANAAREETQRAFDTVEASSEKLKGFMAEKLRETQALEGELRERGEELERVSEARAELQGAVDAATASASESAESAAASAGELQRLQHVESELVRLEAEKQSAEVAMADAVASMEAASAHATRNESEVASAHASAFEAWSSREASLESEVTAKADAMAALQSEFDAARGAMEADLASRAEQVSEQEALAEQSAARESELRQECASVSSELAEVRASSAEATKTLPQQGQDALSEHDLASRVAVIEQMFERRLHAVQAKAAEQLAAVRDRERALKAQVGDLSMRAEQAERTDHDFQKLEKDLTDQMLAADRELRHRRRAEARLGEAQEELSELHESIEVNSRTSATSNALEDALRQQISTLQSKVDEVGGVTAQLLVDGLTIASTRVTSDGQVSIVEQPLAFPNTDGAVEAAARSAQPLRSAVQQWAASTGTELHGAEDSAERPQPDDDTRLALQACRKEMAALERAKAKAEKELKREIKRRQSAEAKEQAWERQTLSESAVSLTAAEQEAAVNAAVEKAVHQAEEQAHAWITKIQAAREMEKKAIVREREEAANTQRKLEKKLRAADETIGELMLGAPSPIVTRSPHGTATTKESRRRPYKLARPKAISRA